MFHSCRAQHVHDHKNCVSEFGTTGECVLFPVDVFWFFGCLNKKTSMLCQVLHAIFTGFFYFICSQVCLILPAIKPSTG